jgi:hypothetical protein
MSGIIYIRDQSPKGFICVSMSQILASVRQHGSTLVWSILELEARGDPALLERGILDLEAEISESPRGLILPWEGLDNIAGALTEVLDCVIVACKDESLIPSYQPGFDPRPACEIMVEMFDSSYWRVYSKEDEVLNSIARIFKDTEIVLDHE